MDYVGDLMWACDRLMHCVAAQDVCEVNEWPDWHTKELYLRAKIKRIQQLM